MLIDFRHDDSTLALMREFDVALYFLDNFYHIDLLCGYDIADVSIDDGILFKDLHVLEIYRLLLLVASVFI